MRITTLQQFRDFARDFNWSKFAFDTETTSLDWWELAIEGISLYDGKNKCYIDLVDNPEYETLVYNVGTYLTRADIIIGHYLTFDFEALVKVYGIKPINQLLTRVTLIDTQVAAFLIDERESTKLKGEGGCCERMLHREAKTYDEIKTFARSSEQFTQYAIADAVNTWDLWQVEKYILKEQGLETVFRIDCDFIPVKIEMELTGVLIDQKLLIELEHKLDDMKCELEEEILKCLGPNPTNQSYLFGTPIEAIGLTSHVKLTKLVKEKFNVNLPNTQKETIQNYINIHPFFELLLKYKAVMKLLSTYIIPYWSLIKPDNRIHAEYHTCRSGREIATNPNLENQAKENELVPEVNIRKLFIASPGKKYLRLDYSQQEVRIVAHNANESNVLRAFNNEWDVHLLSANRILGLGIREDYLCEKHPKFDEVKEYFDKERTKFKTVNFGIAYGKQPSSFAKEWKVPIWEAKKAVDKFFQMFPIIKQHIEDWNKFQKKHLYTQTLLGRRRRYDKPITKRLMRSGFNHTIQGTGADMMKKAAGEVWRYFQKLSFSTSIVLWVHDEIIIEADEKYIEQLVEPVTNIMINTIKLRCPLKTDSKIVSSYGD